MPKASILCPSYNHEKYVKYFIESVLNQTEQDFELIIVDDCSIDNNVSEIEKFKDERIKLIKHEYNKGINAALTDLINASNSEILCLVASDDVLCENYLEEVLKIFEKSKDLDVCYSSLQFIDTNNQPMEETIKLNPETSKYEILKKSFLSENQLPAPGMALKKSKIKEFLPLPYGLLVTQDWHLHHILLLKCKAHFSDKFLVKYRISNNSASAPSNKTFFRIALEADKTMEPFLDIQDIELFKSIFEGEYNQFGTPTIETIPYFLARIALTSETASKRDWGYRVLIDFISKDNNLDMLHDKFNFDFKQFSNLLPESNEYEKFKKLDKKLKKYKKLYNIFIITTVVFALACMVLGIFLLKG